MPTHEMLPISIRPFLDGFSHHLYIGFEGRRPAKPHPSLHGASYSGTAGLNLSKSSPKIRAPRHSRVRAHFFVALVAASLASALSFFGLASQDAQAHQKTQRPAPPPIIYRPVTAQVTLESSPQLFSTMCALWAAGFYKGYGTEDLPIAWRNIADEMSEHTGPATDDLHQYLIQHEHADRNVTLSRFISFALVTEPPPDFRYVYRREELPPDVLTVEDFNGLLARFYKEADLATAWKRVEPTYQIGIAQLQAPVTQIVTKTMGYLREIFKSDSPRTFTVYLEPLAGMSTNFRNYGDAYSVVLDGENVQVNEIRHAFLHFLIDPLPAKYATAIFPSRAILLSANRNPRLPNEYREDIVGYYAECLIKAIELQLDHLTIAQREHAMDVADENGFVLVRPLVTRLEKFQQEEPAMSYYFPDLVKGVDVAAEFKRVQAMQFAPAANAAPLRANASDTSEREQMLQEGERLLNAQDGPGAQAVFERVLARWPGTPRATYGLAISAIYQKQTDRAIELFTSLTKPPADGGTIDPSILAWSHVYLGRFNDGKEEREKAIAEYRAAIAVPGAPERARQAAQSGIQKPYEPAVKPGDRPGGPGNQ
jgi:hypothetical protein